MRINMQKFIAVLHINNEVSEKESKKKKLHEEKFLNYMKKNKIK